jgi:Trichohyalin-plectin-homology domain
MEFRKSLAEQMQKQAEQTGWMDKFYAEEQEKEWAKRQKLWDADAEARKSLMREVAETRLQQMQEKQSNKSLLKEHDKEQIAIWKAQQDAADAKERARQEERKALAARAAEYTRQQLEDKRRRDEAEKQAEYLSWRLQQKEEKEYAARVQALLKDPATFRR